MTCFDMRRLSPVGYAMRLKAEMIAQAEMYTLYSWTIAVFVFAERNWSEWRSRLNVCQSFVFVVASRPDPSWQSMFRSRSCNHWCIRVSTWNQHGLPSISITLASCRRFWQCASCQCISSGFKYACFIYVVIIRMNLIFRKKRTLSTRSFESNDSTQRLMFLKREAAIVVTYLLMTLFWTWVFDMGPINSMRLTRWIIELFSTPYRLCSALHYSISISWSVNASGTIRRCWRRCCWHRQCSWSNSLNWCWCAMPNSFPRHDWMICKHCYSSISMLRLLVIKIPEDHPMKTFLRSLQHYIWQLSSINSLFPLVTSRETTAVFVSSRMKGIFFSLWFLFVIPTSDAVVRKSTEWLDIECEGLLRME